MKKTVEITRELLFGRRRLPSNLRAGFTLALAFAVWLRPPLGALAGCAVFFLLSGAALLRTACCILSAGNPTGSTPQTDTAPSISSAFW